MAKPILVIRVSKTVFEQQTELNSNIAKHLDNEYHVLVVGGYVNEDFTFEVHNVDGQPEIDYEELKKLINK